MIFWFHPFSWACPKAESLLSLTCLVYVLMSLYFTSKILCQFFWSKLSEPYLWLGGLFGLCRVSDLPRSTTNFSMQCLPVHLLCDLIGVFPTLWSSNLLNKNWLDFFKNVTGCLQESPGCGGEKKMYACLWNGEFVVFGLMNVPDRSSRTFPQYLVCTCNPILSNNTQWTFNCICSEILRSPWFIVVIHLNPATLLISVHMGDPIEKSYKRFLLNLESGQEAFVIAYVYHDSHSSM